MIKHFVKARLNGWVLYFYLDIYCNLYFENPI